MSVADPMTNRRPKFSWVFILSGVIIAAGVGAFFVWPMLAAPLEYISDSPVQISNPQPLIIHLPTPAPTRGLYMTQCVAGMPSLRQGLIKIADETEINAIVVDLKDYSGAVAFPSSTAIPGGRGCHVADFASLVKEMHEHQIYVIGRLTVFQDPLYTKVHPEQAVQSARGGVWRDRKGLSFVDVGAKPFWDYIVKLANEAYELGVDEINFDYIRYPSDGDMKDVRYTFSAGQSHAENLEQFFAYLNSNIQFPTSADLFGLTTTNYDDLNIGQVLERALPYFDFIDPMVYPSHYPPRFNGWPNPNVKTYEIVQFSMSRAVARTVATTTKIASLAYERVGTSTPAIYSKPAYPASKMRPWLQDFDYPVTYTSEMVKSQIQATYDVGLDSWLMWSPSNEYTVGVLAPQ